MKYLVVAGCSNGYGSETLGDFNHSPESINYAYGAHIAKHLNLEYKNIAFPGISNTEIAHRIFTWIKHNKNIFDETLFIIGWTGIGRVRLDTQTLCNTLTPSTMWYYAYDNCEDSSLVDQCMDTCKKIDPDNTFFKTYLKYFAETQEVFLKDTLCRLSVDLLLQKYNIKYLTFLSTCSIKSSWRQIDKHYKPLFSLKNNIFDYSVIHKCSKRYGTAKGGHMNKRAHVETAKTLINELHNRKIINSVALSNKFLYK